MNPRWYPFIALAGLILVLGLIYLGGYAQRTLRPYLDEEAIGKEWLGEAECMRFGVIAPGPRGTAKIGDQVLCGYHLEWSNIVGGNAEPKEFAPDPGQSDA